MLTSPARRKPGRRNALAAVATGMVLLGAAALFVRRSQAAPKLFGFTKQLYRAEGNNKVMYCIPMSPLMEILLNAMVHDVVSDVADQPKLSNIPFYAEMDVGPINTAIDDMQIKDIDIGEVEFTECRTVRDILPVMPRLVPNLIEMTIHNINVTMDMGYNSGGFLGFGAVSGKARSTVLGSMNLTIAFLAYNDSHVSSCGGDFAITDTEVIGGYGAMQVPVPRGLPMAEIMCYGMSNLGGMFNFKVGSIKNGVMSDPHVFKGLVPTMNQHLHDVAPELRDAMQALHVEIRETISDMKKAITDSNKMVSDALVDSNKAVSDALVIPCGSFFSSCSPPPPAAPPGAPPASPPPSRPAMFWFW